MTDPDVSFSRILLRMTLADVRKMRPDIKTSNAKFHVSNCRDSQGYRWMEFEFEGSETVGYFHNAFEGRSRGWANWLKDHGEF